MEAEFEWAPTGQAPRVYCVAVTPQGDGSIYQGRQVAMFSMTWDFTRGAWADRGFADAAATHLSPNERVALIEAAQDALRASRERLAVASSRG